MLHFCSMTIKPDKKLADFMTLRLDPELKAALEKAAEEEERSIGQLVRIFLREGLERRRGGRESQGKSSRRKRSS